MSLNIDYNNKTNHNYTNPTYGTGSISGGSVSKYNYRTTGMTFNNVINYQHTFNDVHDIRVMAGQEYYEYNTSNFGGSRSKVIMDGFYEPDAASSLGDFGGNSDQYKLLSFFGSAEYSYNQNTSYRLLSVLTVLPVSIRIIVGVLSGQSAHLGNHAGRVYEGHIRLAIQFVIACQLRSTR